MQRKLFFLIFVVSVTFAQDFKPLNNNIFDETETIDEFPKHCSNLTDVPKTKLQLFKYLTNPVRYDRIHPPENYDQNGIRIPANVYIRFYTYYLQNLDTQDLQFNIQVRLQARYKDSRLNFKQNCSNKTVIIKGEEELKNDLWMPHIYFVNERSSNLHGTHSKDILVSISPDGTVLISLRMQLNLFCSMNFRKFPFDQQECLSTIGNWKMNASEVTLHWEKKNPFQFSKDDILTEYEIVDTILYESEIDATTPGFEYGDFIGKYSALLFKIKLKRQFGCYLLEYYFPSMLIIATSWISFWLQADAAPPRTMLGMTSMLTFITLSTSQTRSLPKVSYIKVSEVWFIAGTLFIFASLIEFAFSNLIWRRKKLLDIEKMNTKNLLKKTIIPHSGSNFTLHKDGPGETSTTSVSLNSLTFEAQDEGHHIVVKMPDNPGDPVVHEHHLFTHHQVSRLIDKRARVAFPLAFFVFNIFYWTYVAF